MAGAEDVRSLGHEVDAAEDDVFRLGLPRGELRELEGVALEVGVLDDLFPLVMVAEDHQAAAEALARGVDAGIEGGGVEV